MKNKMDLGVGISRKSLWAVAFVVGLGISGCIPNYFPPTAQANEASVAAVPAGSAPVAGAPGNTGTAGQPGQPGMFGMIMPFLLMFVVMYFLMIRPQQKKMKLQQEMLNNLKQGDEILTASGMLGKVAGITEKVVTVELADNVKVKMLKSQVSQVMKNGVKDIA